MEIKGVFQNQNNQLWVTQWGPSVARLLCWQCAHQTRPQHHVSEADSPEQKSPSPLRFQQVH